MKILESFQQEPGGTFGLQVSQAGSVGRREVCGDVVGGWVGFFESDSVVVVGLLVRRYLIFADVDADDSFEGF